MKKLPDMKWLGLEPCSWPRNTTDVQNPSAQEWEDGLGTSDAGGGMSRGKTNGFLSNLITRQILMDLGCLPGGIFISDDPDSLQFICRWFYCYPCTYKDPDHIYRCVSESACITRWHRDCMMPNMEITQLESPLAYKITSSALPPPGTSGNITGNILQMPSAGYLNVDFYIEGENTDIEIWVNLSNQAEYSISSVPSVGSSSDSVGIDIPIVMDGFQSSTMIPVSKGMFVSLFGKTGEGEPPTSVYLNLRLTPPVDMTNWR